MITPNTILVSKCSFAQSLMTVHMILQVYWQVCFFTHKLYTILIWLIARWEHFFMCFLVLFKSRKRWCKNGAKTNKQVNDKFWDSKSVSKHRKPSIRALQTTRRAVLDKELAMLAQSLGSTLYFIATLRHYFLALRRCTACFRIISFWPMKSLWRLQIWGGHEEEYK